MIARGIPKHAFMSDIAYLGGQIVNGSNTHYNPVLNAQAAQLLFDDLPSGYKPDFSAAKGYVTANAHDLPFQDGSVDYIFADPPYGKNLDGPGLGVLFGCLPEFNRVAREGSVLMVPVKWVEEIKASGTNITQLTGDVSSGKSGLPVCYVLVTGKGPVGERSQG